MQTTAGNQRSDPAIRRTETEAGREQEHRRRSPALSQGPALQALLHGADLRQIPAKQALELSRTVGNSAMLALLERRAGSGPELVPYRCPGDMEAVLALKPLSVPDVPEETAEAPAFGPGVPGGAALAL